MAVFKGKYMDVDKKDLTNMIFCVSLDKQGLLVHGHRFSEDPQLKMAFCHMMEMVLADIKGENDVGDRMEEIKDEDGNVLGTATLIQLNTNETLN
jgi:hypothetical protein